MASTTNDEKTQSDRDNEEIVSAQSVTKKDVLAAYNSGKNYYDLAQQFFGFQSEEAVNRIREIVEAETDQN